MKLDDKYWLKLIVANEENETYGDIYYSLPDCKEGHPDSPIRFGCEIINNETGKNASEDNRGIDEWYDSVEEAYYAWSYKLKKYKKGAAKMTKDDLLKEIDKINDLLAIVDIEAYVDDSNPERPCIRLSDDQGVCEFEDYDDDDDELDERMYSAEEVMDRCQMFFDDTYLDGEICCDCDHDFDTYKEAEKEARRTGYIEEANNIHKLRKYYY